jgi:WD40 repeat protein
LWDVETGTAIGSALEGHMSSVRSVAFSLDGSKLASASYDNTVCLWDVDTGMSIKTKEYWDIHRCSIFSFFHVSSF